MLWVWLLCLRLSDEALLLWPGLESDRQPSSTAPLHKEPANDGHAPPANYAGLLYPILVWYRYGKGDFLVGCFFLAELAVPFIQIRHIMCKGMTNLQLYLWNGMVVVLTFFVSRIGVPFYVYYTYALYRGVPLLRMFGLLPLQCNLGMLSLISMQMYWFGLMVKKLGKYLLHGKEE